MKFYIGQTVYVLKDGRIGRIININETRCLLQFQLIQMVYWYNIDEISEDFSKYNSLFSLNKT